jgi:hypothetical protein
MRAAQKHRFVASHDRNTMLSICPTRLVWAAPNHLCHNELDRASLGTGNALR